MIYHCYADVLDELAVLISVPHNHEGRFYELTYLCRNQFGFPLEKKRYFFKLELVTKGDFYYHRNTEQWKQYTQSQIFILEAICYQTSLQN